MKIVDVDAENINWPAKCCRCGSKKFDIKEHSEKVVLWTTLSVTKYRQVFLNIPVCGGCASAHLIWFGAATLLAGIGASGLYLFHKSVGFVLFWWILAIVCGLIGVNKKPIKIMGFDEDKNTMRIKIYNDAVANEMRRKKQAQQTT